MISIFFNRVFRAIKIDIDLYEEVEKDKSATLQAGIVVVLSSLAAGVGALQLGASNFLLAPVEPNLRVRKIFSKRATSRSKKRTTM